MPTEENIYVVRQDKLGGDQVVLKLYSVTPCTDSCNKSCINRKKFIYIVLAVQKKYERDFAVGRKISSCEVNMSNGFNNIEKFIGVRKDELSSVLLKMDLVLQNKEDDK